MPEPSPIVVIAVTGSPGEPTRHRTSPVDASYQSLVTPRNATPADASAGGDRRSKQLWELLPSGLAGALRPTVRDVTSDVLREIQRTVPEYARSLDGEFGRTLVSSIQQALQQFLDRVDNPTAAHDDRRRLFYRLGQHEMLQGRSLDVLQAAYRVGARVAWQRMSRAGMRAGVPATTLSLLAEAIFAYIDELSALSIEGYAAAQERAAGTRERRRRRLMELILTEPPPSRHAIEGLAVAAGWDPPERVVAVALEAHTVSDPPIPSLDDTVLMDLEGRAPSMIAPAPTPQIREQLSSELAGWRAAVGPDTTLDEAAQSLRQAQHALRLVRQGVLPETQLTWCDEHLLELWLFHDIPLIRELIDSALAPLGGIQSARSRALASTLLAWLSCRGNVRDTAQWLGVHPQTVRARVRDLEEVFGSALDDPDSRFHLLLALRARKSLGELGGANG